jgi:hypothetical protein
LAAPLKAFDTVVRAFCEEDVGDADITLAISEGGPFVSILHKQAVHGKRICEGARLFALVRERHVVHAAVASAFLPDLSGVRASVLDMDGLQKACHLLAEIHSWWNGALSSDPSFATGNVWAGMAGDFKESLHLAVDHVARTAVTAAVGIVAGVVAKELAADTMQEKVVIMCKNLASLACPFGTDLPTSAAVKERFGRLVTKRESR